MKKLLGEALIISIGTLFLFGLAATIGIPDREERAAKAAAEDVARGRGGASFPDYRAPFGMHRGR